METQWSPNLVLAWVCWIGGAAVILFDLFVPRSDDIGHVGIALFVSGAIFNNRELAHRLKEREQGAFELGCESVSRIHR